MITEENRLTPHSSASVDHYTPQVIIEAARHAMGSIQLDPASCAEANEIVRAEHYYTARMDGLTMEWFGRVWCNPPYGKVGGKSGKGLWLKKLVEQLSVGNVDSACLLVTASTSDQWFNPIWERACALCFPYSRIRFLLPDGTVGKANPGHNVVAMFGDVDPSYFGGIGRVVESRGWT